MNGERTAAIISFLETDYFLQNAEEPLSYKRLH